MPTSGHNNQLVSIVTRIEQLEAAKADTTKAINHTYAAAKADGYDIRALRAVVRLRAWDRKELADHEAKVDAYTDALFAFEHTPLGRAMSPPVAQSAEDAKRAGLTVQRVEQTIQQAVFDHLRFRGKPGVVYWHTPNGAFLGGKRNRRGASIQGAIMKKNGVRAGVSDVLIFHDAKLFAIELKAPKGRPTEAQLAFIADIENAGGFTCIAEGIDAAIAALERWQLLRGRAA